MRGYSYFKTDQFNEAIKDFKNVIDLDPDKTDAYLNLGLSLCELNFKETALIYLEQYAAIKGYKNKILYCK